MREKTIRRLRRFFSISMQHNKKKKMAIHIVIIFVILILIYNCNEGEISVRPVKPECPDAGFQTIISQIALARYNQDGSLDSYFQKDGKVLSDILGGCSTEKALGVAVEASGEIVVAGNAMISDGAGEAALVQYKDNGTLNRIVIFSFGTGMFVCNRDTVSSVAIDDKNRILVAGTFENRCTRKRSFGIARYLWDTGLDTTFNKDGKIVTSFPRADYQEAFDLDIDQKKRVVVVGTARISNFRFALSRYTEDGSLDASFNDDGLVAVDFPSSRQEIAYSVAIDGKGRILVAGRALPGTSILEQFAVARYLENGELDINFGQKGVVFTYFSNAKTAMARDIAIDNKNRIVVVGWAGMENEGERFALARYTESGELDKNFGHNGKVLTALGSPPSRDRAFALTFDEFSRIVVAGVHRPPNLNTQFGLVRYQEDGGLDNSFDSDGIVVTVFNSGPNFSAHINAIAIDSQGRIVAVGWVGREVHLF